LRIEIATIRSIHGFIILPDNISDCDYPVSANKSCNTLECTDQYTKNNLKAMLKRHIWLISGDVLVYP